MIPTCRTQRLVAGLRAVSSTVCALRRLSRKKCVIYHTDNLNPYENLAFEQWVYENESFAEKDCLFVWQNNPCVVIGRHQNPWKEANVSLLQEGGGQLCRRSSGGGAVYHDLGNVNFTFFTDRKGYDRKENLQTIVDGVLREWPSLNISVNCRHDIMLNDNFKISGSAAKLGPNTAYHHCTLLVDSDKGNLLKYLTSKPFSFHCKSTESVRSSVLNLRDENSLICFDEVRNTVSRRYAEKHVESEMFVVDEAYENPDLQKISKSLKSWDWTFGKTPHFSIEKEFHTDLFGTATIALSIKHGRINAVDIKSSKIDNNMKAQFSTILLGVKFTWNNVFNVMKEHEYDLHPIEQFNFMSRSILQFLN